MHTSSITITALQLLASRQTYLFEYRRQVVESATERKIHVDGAF